MPAFLNPPLQHGIGVVFPVYNPTVSLLCKQWACAYHTLAILSYIYVDWRLLVQEPDQIYSVWCFFVFPSWDISLIIICGWFMFGTMCILMFGWFIYLLCCWMLVGHVGTFGLLLTCLNSPIREGWMLEMTRHENKSDFNYSFTCKFKHEVQTWNITVVMLVTALYCHVIGCPV